MKEKDNIPVTKGFLLKTSFAIIAFIIITMLPLTFKMGGVLESYEDLSEISPLEIKKAIKRSELDDQAIAMVDDLLSGLSNDKKKKYEAAILPHVNALIKEINIIKDDTNMDKDDTNQDVDQEL